MIIWTFLKPQPRPPYPLSAAGALTVTWLRGHRVSRPEITRSS